MKDIEQIRKIQRKWLNIDKKCNEMDLQLYYFYDYIEGLEGETEQEKYLLRCMEKEINDLKYTIEVFKKEIEQNYYNKVN